MTTIIKYPFSKTYNNDLRKWLSLNSEKQWEYIVDYKTHTRLVLVDWARSTSVAMAICSLRGSKDS